MAQVLSVTAAPVAALVDLVEIMTSQAAQLSALHLVAQQERVSEQAIRVEAVGVTEKEVLAGFRERPLKRPGVLGLRVVVEAVVAGDREIPPMLTVVPVATVTFFYFGRCKTWQN